MAQPAPFSNVESEEDIAQRRKLAMALMGQASDTSPVGHWTQALARAVQGGMSQWGQMEAKGAERDRKKALAEALMGAEGFKNLGDNDRAIIAQNPQLMQGLAGKVYGDKVDPNAELNRELIRAKIAHQRAGGDRPSNLKEWDEFNKMTPDQQNRYLTMKRTQQWKDTGTEFTLPNAANPTAPPVANIPKNVAEKEAQEKIGAARGAFIASYPKAAISLESLDAKTGIVLDEIKEARKLVGGWTTGMTGSALKNVPGTDANALKSRVQTILANVGFDELQNMRAESPTGGALGAIAVQELTYLQSVRGALEQAQRPEDFNRILNQLENFQKGAAERRRRAVDMDAQRFGTSTVAPAQVNPTPDFNKFQGRLTPDPASETPKKRMRFTADGELIP